MCGRYTLTCPDEEALVRSLPFDEFSEIRIQFRPRYNIAPGQTSPLVFLERGKPVLADGLWGQERRAGGLLINARSETADRTAMFRDAYREGRCLIPADGFYEWRREGRAKQPFLFRTENEGVFLMAGLQEGGRYVVLTRDSEDEVAEIHDRMPVLLEPEDARRWLETGELGEAPRLHGSPVSPRVNRIENDDVGCLEPLRQGAFDFGG